MTKTFTCRELGGICDQKFSGSTFMEIVQKGMQHMQSDESHMKKIGDLKPGTEGAGETPRETKEQWFERMQKEFDSREEDK